MKIEKKCQPKYFKKILEGKKTFEIRLADWECREGDLLVLREWDPETKQYTGRSIEKQVSCVVKTKELKFFSGEDINKYGFQVIAFK